MLGSSISDMAAVLAGTGSFGMLGWMLISQVPKSRTLHDEEVAHRTRLEDEILGRKEAPGIPPMPSLSQRLTSQDQAICQIQEVIRQLKPNGGTSLADRIRRIEDKLDSAKNRLDAEDLAPERTQRRKPPNAGR